MPEKRTQSQQDVIYRIDPDDYRYGNLPRYLGSMHSAVGFLLFVLGCSALLALGVLGLQVAETNQKNDLGNIIWLIPLWGAFAIPLGLSMRRKKPPILSLFLGYALLAVPVALQMVLG